MPLSEPTARNLAHTRVVTCRGYLRDDGLLDIEGRIVDTKPYRFRNRDRGGWIEADEPLHDMSVRLTISEDREVIAVEAVIDASPYNYCKQIVEVAQNLVGLRIEPGWTAKSTRAMGANRGCTHLTQLLGPVATTAIQTLASMRHHRDENKADRSPNQFLNTCHSYADDSPVVREHWPEYFRAE